MTPEIQHLAGLRELPGVGLPISARSTVGRIELPCGCRQCDGKLGNLLSGQDDAERGGVDRQCEMRKRFVVRVRPAGQFDRRHVVDEVDGTLGIADRTQDFERNRAGAAGRQKKPVIVFRRVRIGNVDRDVTLEAGDLGQTVFHRGEHVTSPDRGVDHDA